MTMKRVMNGPRTVVTLLLASAGAWAGETAVQLENGVDILQVWTPEQHLYVKGEIGVAPGQLAELEKWMDAHATNWTVLLMRSAAGESYTDVNGQTYRSLDAVEHAMGRGLSATTKFGSLKHPETGQANGAFFILFLQERNFSFYGSEAYERRGLGAKQWAGNLDAAAKRAMRNGGRIVEAARGTITEIDRRLATAMQQEKRRVEEARVQAERRKVAVDEAVTAGEEELATLEELLAGFRNNPDLAGGDLAQTDTAKWRADLKSARGALSSGQTGMAETVTRVAREEIAAAAEMLRQHTSGGPRVRRVSAQVNDANDGSPDATALRSRMEAVERDYAVGNRRYRSGLAEVEAGFAQLQRARILAAEEKRRREQRAAHQREVRRNTVAGASGGAGLLLLLGGIVGNRRRRKIKAKAEALLATRRQELREVSDRLLALMDRAALVIGSEADLPARGYEGQTLAEAKRGIAAVDEAFVISSHVHDLIEQGAALVEPRNPIVSARNFVSGGLYRQAVELLDAEVVCRPASPPPLPGTEGAPAPERLGLADGEEFALELPEWTGRLARKMAEGGEAIDAVDVAWATIVDRREGLRDAIKTIRSHEDRVETLAADGWLGFTCLFGAWVPAMEAKLEEATKTGRADPVAALRGPIADGDRMAGEARALVDSILSFRETRWADIEEDEEELTRRQRATVWMDQRLDELTRLAEDIALGGIEAPVAERVTAFSAALQSFADRVRDAARQAERADDESLPALDAATQEVAQARDELGTSLGVAAETVLVESPERDPSRLLHEGRNQRSAALAALDMGNPETAAAFLDEVDRLVDEARALVHATREAFTSHDAEHRDLVAARDAWEERVEQTRELVSSLRTRYAPAALLVDVDAGEGASFADAPQRLDEGLRSVDGLLERSAAGFASARLLEAREMLQEGSQRVAAGEALCGEIEERRDELTLLEEENAGLLRERARTCEDLANPVSDRRVMHATLTLFAEAQSRLAEAQAAVAAEATANNPYRASHLLADLDERLVVIRGAIDNDLRLHQHAVELLETVRVAEQEARSLEDQAQDDGIPDSRATSEGLGDVQRGSRSLAGVIAAMQEDHGDWRAAADELGAIHATLSEAAVTLRKELRAAREAVQTIKQAEDAVHRASRWSGNYGVHVTGAPGRDSIVDANRAIMAGDYQSCMRHAGFAVTLARQAIAQAEAEEAAIRRRREEAERARRAAARRSLMSSSSSFGSSRTSLFGSSRSSSFGSSSSVGRSSFSSGSGVGRSGW